MKLTQTYIGMFTTNSPVTGAPSDADSTPVAFAYKNGEPSYDIVLTVSEPTGDPSGGAGDLGVYKIVADNTWGDASFSVDDKVDIYIYAIINSTESHAIIDSFILQEEPATEAKQDTIIAKTDQLEFDDSDPSGTKPIVATLASTGLDNIPVTEPGERAATFREMIVQLWMRFFNRVNHDKDGDTITVYQDDSTTPNVEQAVTDNTNLSNIGKAE